MNHGNNRRSYINVPEKGRIVNVVCVHDGCCPNQNSGAVDELQCLRDVLQTQGDSNGGGGDDANAHPTHKEKQAEKAMGLVKAYIDDYQLKKDWSYVYKPRENYQTKACPAAPRPHE